MTSPPPTTVAGISLSGRFANTPGSRRRPWPYDMYLSNVRVMLEPDQDGNIVSEDAKTLDETAPVDYTYSSANPYRERTSEYQALYGGFGQAVQPETQPRRYHWAEKADLSIDGLWMKGPAFEEHVEHITPALEPNEVRQFVPALRAGTLVLFAVCENGVYFYNTTLDGWEASLTVGTGLVAGDIPMQAVRLSTEGLLRSMPCTSRPSRDGSTASMGPGPPGRWPMLQQPHPRDRRCRRESRVGPSVVPGTSNESGTSCGSRRPMPS